MAQQQSDRFLADVFGINSFKMNSTLKDVQSDKQVAENLSFFHRMDNTATYKLTGVEINLPGLKSLDRLTFDTVELTFENNKLHDVNLYVPASFRNRIFKETCDQFNAKYGQAAIITEKNSSYKKYVWNLGTNELTLSPSSNGLDIYYASKIVNKKVGWIYCDRKGKGNGTIQLNLGYLEKSLDQNLTIASFEKILPQWETTGALNHVDYLFNFKTLTENNPNFFINYALKNYDINVTAEDTTSKVITTIGFKEMGEGNFLAQMEKELNSKHYIKMPKLKYSNDITYSNHKFIVLLDKGDSRILITKFNFKLP